MKVAVTKATAVVVAFWSIVFGAQGWDRYRITDIGPAPAPYDADVRSTAINAAGQAIIHGVDVGDNLRVFIYSNGTFADLGILPGYVSEVASSITDNGDVAGDCRTTNSSTIFLYHNGTLSNLGVALGFEQSSGGLIGNNGRVAGSGTIDATNWFAFLYDSGQVTQLPALPGFDKYVNPMALNDAGQIACTAGGGGEHTRACVYSGGQMINIGAFLAPYDSRASGINSSGKVIGNSANGRAFIYNGSGVTDLGVVPGYALSVAAQGINDSDDIVGTAWNFATASVGFIYRRGQMANLNDLVAQPALWEIREAIDINGAGQILVRGHTVANDTRTVLLLTPIILQQAAQAIGNQLITKVTGVEQGDVIVLEASTDLLNWTSRQTNTVQGSSISFTNLIDGSKAAEFFRARL
jgi:uncharacterized membrane protein